MGRSTIIIPVFNQPALTARCLETLLEQGCERIVVVDDASNQETQRMLNQFGDRIKVLAHAQNRGFAESCNEGAAAAQSEFLVFLNNDTVPQPGWLEELERYSEMHPQAAVVGSKLLFPNDTIQHAGVVICQDRYPRHIYTGFPATHPAVNKSRRFQVVTAACMLVRRDAFDVASGFDPAFRNGFEDVDFCLRIGQRGHEIHYCAASVVQHLESVSAGRFAFDRNNVALYRQRWLAKVRPDDLQYYVEDELLRVTYEGSFPIYIEVSPLLATLDGGARTEALERRLGQLSRQVSELGKENRRLALQLGAESVDSPELKYRELRQRIRGTVQQLVPAGATIAVISKGDSALLDFPQHHGWHFPQTDRGGYAGYYPAASEEALAHLEAVRQRGARYLLIPATSLWWLEHYTEFARHLAEHCTRLEGSNDDCVVYQLHSVEQEEAACQR